MEKQPSNSELAIQIDKVDKKVDRKFRAMNTSLNNFKSEIQVQLQPFHDYLVGQEAIDKFGKKSSGISIPADIIKILLWLVAIIAALVGVTTLPS